MTAQYKPGDLLIYKKQKRSTQPGPRAHTIAAAVQNGQFQYIVDKYWLLEKVREDGTLEVRTRGGKRHGLNPGDPNLHRAKWWQRIWHRSRYRELVQDTDQE